MVPPIQMHTLYDLAINILINSLLISIILLQYSIKKGEHDNNYIVAKLEYFDKIKKFINNTLEINKTNIINNNDNDTKIGSEYDDLMKQD